MRSAQAIAERCRGCGGPAPTPGYRWRRCCCAEIDPSDRPCAVCTVRGDADKRCPSCVDGRMTIIETAAALYAAGGEADMAQHQEGAALRHARQIFRDTRATSEPWVLRVWRVYQWMLLADWYRAKYRAVRHAPSCPWQPCEEAQCTCGAAEQRLTLERGRARCARRAAAQEEASNVQ